jgi:hypothetical protein
MSQIEIQYIGEYQLDSNTQALNPKAVVTACKDDMIKTVFVTCVFSNLSYSYGREAGYFEYEDTWDNSEVEAHMNIWMQARKI